MTIYDMVIGGCLQRFYPNKLCIEDKFADTFYSSIGSLFYIIFLPAIFWIFS